LPLKPVVGSVLSIEDGERLGPNVAAPVRDHIVVEEIAPTRISRPKVLDQNPELRLQTLDFAVNVVRPQERKAQILTKDLSNFSLDR